MSKHIVNHDHYELVENPTISNVTHRDVPTHYVPLWLSKLFLAAFSVTLFAILASLLLLWRLSVAEDGFTIGVVRNHLAWKYGPTTILVLVLSLWKKVDYTCKWTQPWINMRKDYVAAHRSLLLDYMNSVEELNLIESIRNHDFRITASVTAMRSLQIAIIASTALLTAIPTESSSEVAIQYNTTFDGTSFWQALSGNNVDSLPDVFSSDGTFSDSAVNAYFGTLRPVEWDLVASTASINYPLGTVNGSAYESFMVPDRVDFTTSTAVADIFVPLMNCEIATIEQVPAGEVPEVEQEDASSFLALLLSSKTCPSSGAYSYGAWGTMNCTNSNETLTPWTCSDVSQSSTILDCSQSRWLGDGALRTRTTELIDSSLNLTTLGFYAVNITNSPIHPQNTSTDYDHILTEAAGFICDIAYSIESVNVTQNHTSRNFTYEIPTIKQPKALPDLSQSEFAQIIFSVLSTSGGAFPVISRTLLHAENGGFIFDKNETMRDALVTSLNGISSQFMQQYFLRPHKADGIGTILSKPERLHVATFALWIMIGCLAVTSIMPVIIIVLSLQDDLPIPTTNLARQAAILTSSSKLQELLFDLGSSTMTDLECKLKYQAFRIDAGIHVKDLPMPKTLIPPLSQSGNWKPFTARKVSIVGTLTLPVACIAIMEALYQKSERDHGFAFVPDNSNTSTFILLTPALVLATIATLYQNLDFLVAMLVPYNQVQSQDALHTDLLGSYPFVSLWKSFQNQYFDFSLAKIAGLLAGVLTVFGSGLLYIDTTTTSHVAAKAWAETFWNSTWDGSNDHGAATEFDSIRLGSTARSAYSWQSYALPIVSSYNSEHTQVDTKYTLSLDALEGILECNVIPQEAVTATTDPGVIYRDRMNFTASASVPEHCGGNVTFTTPWLDMEYTGLVGLFFDLFVGPGNNNTNDVAEGKRDITLERPTSPVGCPSLGIFFGSIESPYSKPTVLVCSQKLQQSQMDVTFINSALDQQLDPENPPILRESTFMSQDGYDTFPYRIEKFIQALNSPDLDPTLVENYGIPIDRFFQRLINSSSAYYVNPDGLIGNEHALIDAVEALYQKYMVTAIENNLRDLAPTESFSLSGAAKFAAPRIRVDEASKTVLQVLLAIITILGMVVYSICPMKDILPRNPCSIASCMSFLAGSQLCTRTYVPKGSEYLSDDELKRLMNGNMFGLGWWSRNNQEVAFRNEVHDASVSQMDKNFRFGIDVGRPEMTGFRQRKARLGMLFGSK